MTRSTAARRASARSPRVLLLICALLLLSSLPLHAAAGDTPHVGDAGTPAVPTQSAPVGPAFDAPESPSGIVHSFSGRGGGVTTQPAPPEIVRPAAIIGEDERVQVSPAFDAIAYLEIYDQGSNFAGSCTGTFIGPAVLLTAAHCLYGSESFGGWASDIRVVPGKDGFSEPNGFGWASGAWVPDSWFFSDGNDPLFDWGLILLPDDTLGNWVGWYSIGMLNDASLMRTDFNPTIVGYPGDKPEGTQWLAWKPAFAEVENFILRYTIDTYGGQSGSAVFRGADGVIVGIHVRGGKLLNEATRIDQEVLDDLLDGCGQLGCAFAYFTEPVLVDPDLNAFQRTWERTDMAVFQSLANRTWIWGPSSITGAGYELYHDAAGGQRVVVYWDKSRMEITYPDGDPYNQWYVTNGLLAWELITGWMQIGDSTYDPYAPATVNVAGDEDDPTGPTYATFSLLLGATAGFQEAVITRAVTRDGVVYVDNRFATYGVGAAIFVQDTQHWIAEPFWNFMNSEGLIFSNGSYVNSRLFESPFYAAGLPITDAYWASVKIANTYRDVLIQCFERRCLTYTPGNPPGWDVEAGNVGRHYYIWRYGSAP